MFRNQPRLFPKRASANADRPLRYSYSSSYFGVPVRDFGPSVYFFKTVTPSYGNVCTFPPNLSIRPLRRCVTD